MLLIFTIESEALACFRALQKAHRAPQITVMGGVFSVSCAY